MSGSTASTLKKAPRKFPRCPKGHRRNKYTEKCDPNKRISENKRTIPLKRCPRHHRRNKLTQECDPYIPIPKNDFEEIVFQEPSESAYLRQIDVAQRGEVAHLRDEIAKLLSKKIVVEGKHKTKKSKKNPKAKSKKKRLPSPKSPTSTKHKNPAEDYVQQLRDLGKY
jgi:hypothetical protein